MNKVRLAVWVRDGRKCVCCGAAEDLTVDHIIPPDIGGSDVMGNLQLLCRGCNFALGKFADDPEVVARALVYLRNK